MHSTFEVTNVPSHTSQCPLKNKTKTKKQKIRLTAS